MASNAPSEPVPSPAPPPPAPAPQSSGRSANGDVTGPSTDTPWGTVQVVARVQNGAIAAIEPIDYPQHRRRSVQINEWALPVLEREVIQAQSANVDIVSQATTTSVGYLQSLAGALAQLAPQLRAERIEPRLHDVVLRELALAQRSPAHGRA